MTIGLLGYALSALGFGAIAVLVLAGWRHSLSKWLFFAACVVSAIWSLGALAPLLTGEASEWRVLLAPVRTSLWAGMLLAILASPLRSALRDLSAPRPR